MVKIAKRTSAKPLLADVRMIAVGFQKIQNISIQGNVYWKLMFDTKFFSYDE
jgi:hypothetical protein